MYNKCHLPASWTRYIHRARIWPQRQVISLEKAPHQMHSAVQEEKAPHQMHGAVQEESVLLLINPALVVDQPNTLDADESFVYDSRQPTR
jgi:hypothetical protein